MRSQTCEQRDRQSQIVISSISHQPYMLISTAMESIISRQYLPLINCHAVPYVSRQCLRLNVVFCPFATETPPGAKTIAIRADMDALPLHEVNELDYRSTVEGKMHACGHDGHTAILLSVAALLRKPQAELIGNVKFLFQPAEEGRGGANLMLKEGVMEGVDGVIGLHLMSTSPVGRVGVRAGPVFASADGFVLNVKGKGGHAAMPQEAVDPIVISAHMITALQTLISRECSPFSPAVITIGTIQAGSAFNIIPETAQMQGTVRAFSQADREQWVRRIRELATGVALAMGGSCDVQTLSGPFACVNDAFMTHLVHEAAVVSVGAGNVDSSEEVMTTS